MVGVGKMKSVFVINYITFTFSIITVPPIVALPENPESTTKNRDVAYFYPLNLNTANKDDENLSLFRNLKSKKLNGYKIRLFIKFKYLFLNIAL